MVGRDVSVVQGETGVLLCSVIHTTDTLSQISWEKQTTSHRQNSEFVTITPESGLNVINGDGGRVKFIGNIDDKNGSLELSGITLMDEGIYTCAFTLFPSGIQTKKISLSVVGMYICVSEASLTCALKRMFRAVVASTSAPRETPETVNQLATNPIIIGCLPMSIQKSPLSYLNGGCINENTIS